MCVVIGAESRYRSETHLDAMSVSYDTAEAEIKMAGIRQCGEFKENAGRKAYFA